MQDEMIENIRIVSSLSVLGPLLFYFLKFNRLARENHIIGLLLLLYGTLDLAAYVLHSLKISTAVLFNTGHLIQFVLINCYFFEVMFKKHHQQFFRLSILFFCLSYLLISSVAQDFWHNQTVMWTISSLIFVVDSVLLYNYLSLYPPIRDKNLDSRLAINGGVLVYFGFNLVLFALSAYYLDDENRSLARLFWGFHNVSNILKNSLLLAGLAYTCKRKIEITHIERETLVSREIMEGSDKQW